MRVYPTQDPYFYIEYEPLWSLYCRTPNKTWKKRPEQSKHYINYYRDLDGKNIENVENKDLLFPDWSNSRIRPGACLPIYYGVGKRFIALQMAGPIGFKCNAMPIPLNDARQVKLIIKETAKKMKNQKKNKKKNAKDQPTE